MIYRFTIISDEVDDFVREIQIDPEATFYDFHEAILKSVGYTNDQMTSFFICDDDWEKEKEITLEEMDDNPEPRFRVFGVGVERDAGHIEESGFFGNVAGVGHDALGLVDEEAEVQIALGRQDVQVGHVKPQ